MPRSRKRLATVVAGVVMALSGAPSEVAAVPAPDSGGFYPVEKVLSYSYRQQETYFWCSAAAAQIALSMRGTTVSQEQLRRQLNLAPRNGVRPPSDPFYGETLGLQDPAHLVKTLNSYDPEKPYELRMPSNSEVRVALRNDVRYNVNHRLGVLINVTKTGDLEVDGHYMTIVGYRSGGARYLIADPFDSARKRVWMSADEVLSVLKLNRYIA